MLQGTWCWPPILVVFDGHESRGIHDVFILSNQPWVDCRPLRTTQLYPLWTHLLELHLSTLEERIQRHGDATSMSVVAIFRTVTFTESAIATKLPCDVFDILADVVLPCDKLGDSADCR